MKPYFRTHSAGWLFLCVVIAFFGMEIIQLFRQRSWRRHATRIATPAFWVGVTVWTIIATVMLHRGSDLAPSASIGNGAGVFIVGMVTAGPYRVLRHPGYTGGLLAMIGMGVVYANRIGLAGFVLPCLIIIVWRIRIEETALLCTTGDSYRAYAAHHKRLLPLIW